LNQLRFLRWVLLAASAAVTLLSVLVAALAVRRGLSPLTAIAGEIEAIKENDLATRIGAKAVPGELLPIRERLNDLLSRLEAAFKRERRFTADVAHELRTPLAGIRSTVEVTLAQKRGAGEYQVALSECLAIVQNMQTMVNNLLMLARLDTHQATFLREKIDVAGLVDSVWRLFAGKAVQRNISFENRIPVELTCESDAGCMSLVFSNLLDNAVEYTNEGGRIWVTARRADDSVVITVSNTGCRMTGEQASQAFNRFWRSDSARSDAGVHCGLGLALVQKTIQALGGSVTVETQPGEIFAVRLNLPTGGWAENTQ